MLCYRCGGRVQDGAGKCASCGQRRATEGAPCLSGELIAGRYQVEDEAGSGPLGWVFRALEVSTGAAVALKVLSPRFVQTAEEKRTFVDVLHRARRLVHPNIARIHEAGNDGGRPFVAGQLLEGLTLRRILDLRRQKGQPFTLREVGPIVAQIAAALDAASAAFAHGNLKPDNVIVLPDLVKLTDFGLAVGLPRTPFMAAQRAATVHRYLAPEFLLGEPLDARSDVFSLGVMLAELLSGAQSTAPLDPIGRDPTLPGSVEALLRRAVSPRPGARYASAGEMAAELSALAAAAPAPARDAEDAGEVVIVEAFTDPRVRIARALRAARAPDPSETPQPPIAAPARASTLASAPFALPPYQAPALTFPTTGEIRQIAASAGATPGLLTAETAVRPAPPRPDAPEPALEVSRPRRGAGKRGKDRFARGRRRTPGGIATVAPRSPAPRTPAPFVAMEDRRPSRAPLFAAGAVGLALLAGGAFRIDPSHAAEPKPAEAASRPEPVQAEPSKATEPSKVPEPARAAEPVRQHAVPSRRDGAGHLMRDRVRAVKDRVEKALEERRRQREEAAAAARTR